MMKRLLASLSTILWLAAPVWAQTATTTTTVSTAMTATAGSVVLASATNVAAGGALFIDGEAMTVISVNSTTARVGRSGGGVATAHAVGAIVYVATAAMRGQVFRTTNPSGACTASDQAYLPIVNTTTGDIWDCPAGVGLWVNLKRVMTVECRALLIADMVDQSCFTADRPYVVTKITEVHKVAESGGTLTILPKRQSTTQAPASGDLLITTNFNAVATAETVQTGTLTATPAYLLLTAGQRLGLDFTDDTAGELAGVTVTFQLYPR